jgi:hypothetical protein
VEVCALSALCALCVEVCALSALCVEVCALSALCVEVCALSALCVEVCALSALRVSPTRQVEFVPAHPPGICERDGFGVGYTGSLPRKFH